MKEIFDKFIANIQHAFSTPELIVFSVLDIVITFLLVYGVISFLRRNNALRMFKYLAIFLIVSIIFSKIPVMPVLGVIGANVVIILVLVIFVLYGNDFKRVMRKLYSPKEEKHAYNIQYECSDEELRFAISDIVKANPVLAA